MNDKFLHINNLEQESKTFFSKGKINWKKTEEEVWAEMENKIAQKPTGKSVSIFSNYLKWSVAAVFLLLVGFTSTLFLYKKTVVSIPGQFVTAHLPDGSTVEMNAASTLKYYPLKWRFQRKLEFEGEGFFVVNKGEKFEVVSANGITEVLGTTFNIYSRDSDYRVTCLTGKVKVSNSNESVLLLPDNHVELENGKLIMKALHKNEKTIDWKQNRFDFTGRSLREVFNEISRQYGVKVEFNPELGYRNFSSNFSRPENAEEVLDYVCKSMQLKYIKQSEKVFLIVNSN